MAKPTVCYDHLGNKFKSVRALCTFYNLSIGTYIVRKKNNWPLKDILTIPPSYHNCLKKGKAPRTDHLGKTYPTFIAMCEAYGLTDFNVQNRLNHGWSMEKALTTPIKKQKEVIDHLGNKFKTKKDLCKHYNISTTTLKDRLNEGMSLKEALTKSKKEGIRIDHLGNIYKSQNEMCKHYNINTASFKERLEKGYSLEEALTAPKKHSPIAYENHIGEKKINNQGYLVEIIECFRQNSKTKKIKVRFEDGTEKTCYYNAFANGAVTHPKSNEIEDHLGNKFDSISQMCRHYNIDRGSYDSRLRMGWSLEKILTEPLHRIRINSIFATYIKTFNGKHYYKCQCKKCNWEHKKILTMQEILQHEKECSQ